MTDRPKSLHPTRMTQQQLDILMDSYAKVVCTQLVNRLFEYVPSTDSYVPHGLRYPAKDIADAINKTVESTK